MGCLYPAEQLWLQRTIRTKRETTTDAACHPTLRSLLNGPLLDKAQDLGLQLHPGYAGELGTITTIGGGEFISAAYAPQADSNERHIVTVIRLSCLTEVPACSTVADLMPSSATAL